MDDLSTTKNKLFEALGDGSKQYLELLRMWFKHKLSKLDFDTEARKLLNKSAITFHNKFLVSLFYRCQQLSGQSSMSSESINLEEPKRKKPKIRSTNKPKLNPILMENCLTGDQRQHYASIQQQSALLNKNNLDQLLTGQRKIMFCSTEGTLPDYFMSNLRLFVNVWEFGMDGITDDSIHLVNLAIRDFIKNIIHSILIFKSDFRTCENERFQYAFGTGTLNPFLINSSTFRMDRAAESHATVINENGDLEPTLPHNKDFAIQNALLQVACSTCGQSSSKKINLWHLYYCLKNDPTCIPTHSIKATNIERIQMRLSTNGAIH